MAKRKFNPQEVLGNISQYFDRQNIRVYSLPELIRIVDHQRDVWRLRRSVSFTSVLEQLESAKLKHHSFHFPAPYRSTARYSWGTVSIYEVVQTLRPNSYFTHQTALFFHQLLDKEPDDIYLNFEQATTGQGGGRLSQTAINRAFANKPRTTNYMADLVTRRVFVLNGRQTGGLGVIPHAYAPKEGAPDTTLHITNLERTLIDITVRPAYARGADGVLSAFRRAVGRIDLDQFIGMYRELAYVYPYHQAIGYYLEAAGHPNELVKEFEKMAKKFKFFLDNRMKSPAYIDKWKLYVPSCQKPAYDLLTTTRST